MMTSRRSEPLIINRKDLVILFLIIILAISLRVIGIEWRPLSNDEASHIYFGIKALNGEYTYDPEYHGPLEHYIIALVISLARKAILENPFALIWSVRLAYASFLLLTIVVIYIFFRDYLGKIGAVVACVLYSIMPEFLYYSRFAHEDIISVSLAVITFIMAYRLYKDRRITYLYGLAISFALLFSAKENWIVYLGIWTSYLVLILIIEKILNRSENNHSLHNKLKTFFREVFFTNETINEKKTILIRRNSLIHTFFALILFLFISFLLYSSFFKNPSGFITAVIGPIHWIIRHQEPRIPGPFYYWFNRILLYDLFIIVGFILTIKKYRDYTTEMLLWWFLLSFLGYSYLQEKLPRLMMHITAPAVLFISRYLNDTFYEIINKSQKKKTLRSKTVVITIVILIGISFYQSILLNYVNYDDMKEPLVYARLPRGWQEVYTTIEDVLNEKGSMRILIVWEGNYGLWPIIFWLHYVEKDLRGENLTYYVTSRIPSESSLAPYDMIICYYTKDQGSISNFSLMGDYSVLKWVLHEGWSTGSSLSDFINTLKHYLDPRFYFLREYDPEDVIVYDHRAVVYIKDSLLYTLSRGESS